MGWKEEYDVDVDDLEPEAFLNGIPLDQCSQVQQMLYWLLTHAKAKIGALRDRIVTLETQVADHETRITALENP